MKKKRIEKMIFNILLVLPLLIVGVFFAYQLIYSHNHDYVLTIPMLFSSIGEVFSGATSGMIYAPIYYLLNNIVVIGSSLSNVVALYLQYCIVIELAWLCYKVIVFIPRACSSIIDKGLGD